MLDELDLEAEREGNALRRSLKPSKTKEVVRDDDILERLNVIGGKSCVVD